MTKSTAANLRATKSRRKTGDNSIGIWIVGISAAIVLVVVLAVALSNRPTTIAAETPDLPAEWLVGTTMGDPNAPVTIQAWEDFMCPACRQWTTSIEPQLIDEYIKTGVVRLEFHQFPLSIHAPGAEMGAQASLCANDQNAFWPYHNRLFPAQDQGQAGFTIDSLVRYADELGLDSRALMDCMSSQKYRTDVTTSVNEALSLGLNATPSILVNGVPMENPFDFEGEMKALIENALAESGT
jgi:protein-disulfide isomerase